MSDTAPQIGFRQATYLTSAHNLSQLPDDHGAEVAFAGRSNAGKSSTINRLTGQKSLARTSKTPGRTQQMVFFELDEQHRLVDLPGYGYAKVPPKMREHWARALDGYFRSRQCLRGVVIIMDVRHPLREFDEQMLAWTSAAGIPCHAVLNKADKLKRGAAMNTLQHVQKQMRVINPGSSASLHSSLKGTGQKELAEVVSRWLTVDSEASGE
jgi:GTP-binding protein